MDFSFNIYAVILFIGSFLLAGVSIPLVAKRGSPRYFSFTALATGVWVFGYAFELMSPSLEWMYFWTKFQYLGSALIPGFMIQFIHSFTGNEHHIQSKNQFFWFLIPVITIGLVFTLEHHQLIYLSAKMSTEGPFPMMDLVYGPWYWVYNVFFYCVMVWSVYMLIRRYRSSEGLYRKQTLLILIASIIPWTVNVFYMVGYRPFQFLDLTPFVFIFSGLSISYGLMRFQLFQLVPIARDTVIEGMKDGVMVLDTLDRVVDYNPMMLSHLKEYTPNLIGKHPSEIVPEATQLLELIDQHEQTRMVISLGSRTMQIQATPIFDKEKKDTRSGMLMVWRDVTDQEMFERELLNAKKKAEESDRLKTAFLANMSHEIRNPMHAILGFTEILRDPDTAEADRLKYTDIIAQSAQKLLGLLNDIIDLSKVEAGQDPLLPEAADVNETLEDVIGLMGMVARKKGITLGLGDLLPTSESVIETDHRKLRQILINLVSNGIKYTDNGSVTLSVHRVGQHVFFKVKDTGIGMDGKALNVIFERFRQADEKSGKHIGGTGLGLSISKAYADLMGGLISVESTKGSGSTFTLRIPYKKALITKDPMSTEPDRTQDPIPDLSAFSILLAEDEPVNVKFLQITLKKTKANVIVARNGLEALNIALDQNIDLILMDIMMPEMDGFEASKRIRKQKPDLPILGLSGHAMVEEEKIADAGITELLTKPIQGLDLIRKLDQYLTKTRP